MKYTISFKRYILHIKSISVKKIKKILEKKENEIIYKKGLKYLYKLCDGRQKQYLTRNEFKILVKDILNEPITDQQIIYDFEIVDPTNKNKILFDAFVQWYNNSIYNIYIIIIIIIDRINEYECSGYIRKVYIYFIL